LGFHPSASALRGSQGQGAPDAHLLSAVSHRLGVTLAQRAVGDKTDEIPITPALLHDIILTGRVFTMDALLTQQAIAQAIIDGGGDHVMVVKENQPQLYADIDRLFAAPAAEQDTWGTARTVDKGHGRSEQRRLTASTALVGYSDWPGLAQVFELERRVIHTRTGEITTETVYGVSPATACALTDYSTAYILATLVNDGQAIRPGTHRMGLSLAVGQC
jgi:hypothetical protein